MKNLLGFVKNYCKTAAPIFIGCTATVLACKIISKKARKQLEKVNNDYEEMDTVIETTKALDLPEYSEEDYKNDKKINKTKKTVKTIIYKAPTLITASIYPLFSILPHVIRMRKSANAVYKEIGFCKDFLIIEGITDIITTSIIKLYVLYLKEINRLFLI